MKLIIETHNKISGGVDTGNQCSASGRVVRLSPEITVLDKCPDCEKTKLSVTPEPYQSARFDA